MGRIRSFFSKFWKITWGHKKTSIVVLIVLLIAGFIFWPKSTKTILTQAVIRGDVVKTVSVTGKITSDKSVDLSFQIGGTLAYLGVKKGDTVKAYQTIATLDQRTVQKNLQIALANYSQERNAFETNKENDNPNNLDVNNLDLKLKRILQDNQFDLDKSVYSVELQDLARQESILTTPIDGVVTRTDALTAGVNITPMTVFSVTDPNSLSFSMDVDEADIGNVKVGQDINVSLDAFPNNTLKLKVLQIDFVSHLTTSGGTAFTVKGALPFNNDYRVGINGNADIITALKKDVLNIPLSAVMEDSTVYVKNSDGSYSKKKVALGLESDTQAEVLSGLSQQDSVAVDPSSVPQQNIRKK